MQVNGTQLAAGCEDGTVIAWSYPKGEILFQMNEHEESIGIKWNPFRQDVFVTRHGVRNAADSLFDSPVPFLLGVRNAVNCLFHCLLFEGRRKSF